MKSLVTGGAGFIGSHLVDRLLSDHNQYVSVYDNLSRGKIENLSQHCNNSRFRFIEADIRDFTPLLEAVQGVDVIYHLGAQSSVMQAITDIDYSFTSNVVGTYNVLKAASKAKVSRVVFSSSREVYGEPNYLPVDEEHPTTGKNSYGASKVAAEEYCRVFNNHFGLKTVILRLANVYGARDYDRVIPIWLEQAYRGKNITVYGGTQIIDFIWIDLVVEAFIQASQIIETNNPINVGSGKGTPLLELARIIQDIAPGQLKLDIQPAHSAEVIHYIANVQRMRTLLALEPPADPLYALPKLLNLFQKSDNISSDQGISP